MAEFMYSELLGEEGEDKSADDGEDVDNLQEEKDDSFSAAEVMKRIDDCIWALERGPSGPKGAERLAELVEWLEE